MSENKVVIKINYDKSRSGQVPQTPKMVTVWHTGRIAAVAGLMAAAIMLSAWLFIDNSEQTPANLTPETLPMAPETSMRSDNSIVAPQVETSPLAARKSPGETPVSPSSISEQKRQPAIIYSRKVIRASLTYGIKDTEPTEQVKSASVQIRKEPIELYYFNEVKNLKGKTLFHQWFKDGQPVLKKTIEVKDNKAKVWTAKNLSSRDKGQWRVQLLGKKGELYSETGFDVIQ
ncbi:DUF2914 domain-containing protein [Methylomonas sp. MED-D]|uniref:DUF2914 domain-containing protein n=1 Tax=unclassified Methylomonas TaxID=2608980 RepID=UPI0028A42522|nr:DUF2914 domain-containing protein [Methylomonas sp. MV1]MDT4328352.1 DUF2914 domain-containing protein [Methylomonas sp. MV1]